MQHRQRMVQSVSQDRLSSLLRQQQGSVRRMRKYAPYFTRANKHIVTAAAGSALQDLEIRPFTPVQQPSASDSSSDGFQIPPLSEWGNNEFLMAGCEPHAAPLRVAVLVSGGVDSSLALQLVAAAGHQPTAFYLQIWFQEDFRNFWDSCPWEEDLDYAQKVCDALGIPLVVVPLTQQYWDRVVSHSVAEIRAGRTPNPDMLCNSRVKFGAFVEYLETEHAGQFDRIASGHYARMMAQAQYKQQQQQQPPQDQQQDQRQHHVELHPVAAAADSAQQLDRLASHSQASSSSGQPGSSRYLSLTPDAVKDQTYFLANLSAAQLSRCMFPLGGFTKPQVRALATAAGLATSGRKDSQGICFLGKVKFNEFVKEHLGEWPGPLVEEDSGKVVGIHSGYWFYTVGQRGGIKLPGGPWYVTAKDMTQNVVYVSRSYYEADKRRDAFVCGPFNWLSEIKPQPDRPLYVKVRHGPNMMQCQLTVGPQQEILNKIISGAGDTAAAPTEVDSSLRPNQQQEQQQFHSSIAAMPSVSLRSSQLYGMVVLSENDQGLAAGQYAVFYQDGICLGSAQMLGTVAK